MVEALLDFGPIEGHSNIPFGSFLMKGMITGRSLELDADHWISRPSGYAMVGLSGIVSGDAYEGSVTGAFQCGEFHLTKQPAAGPRDSTLKTAFLSSTAMLVPLRPEGGTFTVAALINNKLTLNFVLDSGAADVSIPANVVLTLMRTGTLDSSDFLGEQLYKLANGSTVPSKTFRIRSLMVGNKVLENVTASVAPVQASLLLGQSFLGRFKSWSIDNQRRALILE
jgi:clan AA aspartic protease (TIGR02281 family)